MVMNRSLNATGDSLHSIAEPLSWSNPSSLITYDAYYSMAYYFNNVMKPLVFIVGFPTGVLNCKVFRRQGLGDRMVLCLFVLALVDTTFVCFSMVFSLAFWIRILEPIFGEELHVKMQYALSLNYGLREASACISVVVAVERCVCVVFPLRANSLMTTRTMGILLVAIVISMQLAFVTTPFKRYVYPVYDNSTGATRWTVGTAAAWQRSEGLLVYDIAEDMFMMIVFPMFIFILVTGSTIITVVKLRAAVSWREKASSASSDAQVQQVALTKMLVLVSCVFIASKVPWVVITLTRICCPDFSPSGSQSNIYRVLELVAHYFFYVHSSVNFFIYYSRSSRFQSHLRTICASSHKPAIHANKPFLVSVIAAT